MDAGNLAGHNGKYDREGELSAPFASIRRPAFPGKYSSLEIRARF